ncbi:MAG TPA: multicopper oxidase domain-containing protein [Anaerolineales bacterium]|nr:multicopper oxidase domain-containing protein [Anaerolineales bacterium]
MLSRRDFFKLSGAGILSLYAASRGKFPYRVFALSIPGGTLDPGRVPKYQTPLLIPPAMPRAGKIKRRGKKQIDYYEIAMRQFSQQILPPDLPATTVWGYGPVVAQDGPQIFNAPSLTIEAKANTPVRIKWINELVDAHGNFLPHLLPVDPTLHWANPPQTPDNDGNAGPDRRPAFSETPGPYTGPVPIVSHLHGAVGVGDESDGYAEAWYLPAANNIPAGYATQGTWYEYFKGKAAASYGAAWGPGFATFQYPNHNRASTIWYHDHALGMTRLNVYAGPAGFFIVRGGPSGDGAVLDSSTGLTAVLPGPAPALGDAAGMTYYEIPIAIQDRAFNTDGSLFYPDTRAFFDEFDGPFIPETDVSPIWNPEFFGNMIMVNGNTWPFQQVEQRRYRFRFLNGCQSRFLILDFSNIPGVEVWQIGNEGGFLAAPVNLTADHNNRLLMGLAERADLIVDFTNVVPGDYVLGNLGPDEPFGGGEPGHDFDAADPDSTGQIMQFRVVPATAPDPTTPPQFLTLPPITPLPAPATTRPLALIEMMSEFHDGPAEAMLGQVDTDGMPMHQMWSEPISENPNVGDTEVWEFYNFTADAHPMHVHEVVFEVVNRQALKLNEEDETAVPVEFAGDPRPPEPWENGLKDTVIAYPGEVTRIKAKFDKAGTFVWHCHIVEHEDNEMMRPYRIGSPDPNAPGGHGM